MSLIYYTASIRHFENLRGTNIGFVLNLKNNYRKAKEIEIRISRTLSSSLYHIPDHIEEFKLASKIVKRKVKAYFEHIIC